MKKFISLLTLIGLVLLGFFQYSNNEVKAIDRFKSIYNFIRINEKTSVSSEPYGIVDGVNYIYKYIKPNYQNLQNGYYGIRLLADSDNKEFYLYLNIVLDGQNISKVNAYVTHRMYYDEETRKFGTMLKIFESNWNGGNIDVIQNTGFYLPKNTICNGEMMMVDVAGEAIYLNSYYGINDQDIDYLFDIILEGTVLKTAYIQDNKDYHYLVDYKNPPELSTIVNSFGVSDYTQGDLSDDIFIVYTDYSKKEAVLTRKRFVLMLGVLDDSLNGNLITVNIRCCDVSAPNVTCPEYIEADCQVKLEESELLKNFVVTKDDNGETIRTTQDASDYLNNWSTPGEYTVNGVIKDGDGNTTNTSYKVKVKDTIAPVITLSKTKIDVDVLDTFTMSDLKSYISVTDNYDGNITDYDVVDEYGYFENKGGVDTYKFTVTAKDAAGNETEDCIYLAVYDDDEPQFIIPDCVLVLKTGTTVTREQILEYVAKTTSKAVQSFSTYILDVENPNGEYLIDVVYEDGTKGVVKLDFSLSKDNLFGKTEIEKMLTFNIGERITNEQIISLLESTYNVNIASIEEGILVDEILTGEYLVTVTYEDGTSEVVKLDFSLTDTNNYEYVAPSDNTTDNSILYWITGGIGLVCLAYFVYKRLK